MKISDLLQTCKKSDSFLSMSEDSSIKSVLAAMYKVDTDFVLVYKLQDSKKSVLGFVSCTDIITFASFQEIFDVSPSTRSRSDHDQPDPKFSLFLNSPIKACVSINGEPNLPILSDQDSIGSLVNVFAMKRKDHRPLPAVLVLAQDFYFVDAALASKLHCVTPTDLLECILVDCVHTVKLTSLLRSQLVWKQKRVIAVSEDTLVLQAFKNMQSNGLQCAPVVAKEGRIVGTLSSRDIRKLGECDASGIEKCELSSFIDLDRLAEDYGHQFSLPPSSTLEQGLRVMLTVDRGARPQHPHVWIVGLDKDRVIRGVLTITDFFEVLASASSRIDL